MANPFPIILEEGLPDFVIPDTAHATVVELTSPGTFPASPNPIDRIRSTQAWGVRTTWQTGGPLSSFLAGEWVVTVYLERMGGGEFSLPGNVKTEALVATDPRTYVVDMAFAAGTVPAGAYKIAVTVTMRGPAPGFVPGPIGGVGDGPLLQFYNAA